MIKRAMLRSSKYFIHLNSFTINFENNRKEIHAFDIDSEVKDGRLALIYRGPNTKP